MPGGRIARVSWGVYPRRRGRRESDSEKSNCQNAQYDPDGSSVVFKDQGRRGKSPAKGRRVRKGPHRRLTSGSKRSTMAYADVDNREKSAHRRRDPAKKRAPGKAVKEAF